MLCPSRQLKLAKASLRLALRLNLRAKSPDEARTIVAAELELPAVVGLLQHRVDVVVPLAHAPQPRLEIRADAHVHSLTRRRLGTLGARTLTGGPHPDETGN